MQDEKANRWFEKHGLTPPAHISHGVILDELSSKLQPLKAKSWHMEGNRLIAETDAGKVVNYLPTNVVMTHVDENNMPRFKRI